MYFNHIGREDPILWPLLLLVIGVAAGPFVFGLLSMKIIGWVKGQEKAQTKSWGFWRLYFSGSAVFWPLTVLLWVWLARFAPYS